MLLVEKIKIVLFKPSKFFEKIKKEPGIKEALKYILVLALISLIATIIEAALKMRGIYGFLPFRRASPVYTGIFIYISIMVMSFVGAGVVHLFARLLKGKGSYAAAYKACVYSITPSLLFGWIPIQYIGIIFTLWSLCLLVIGLSKLYSITTGRAFCVVLLAIVLPSLIIGFFTIVATMFFYGGGFAKAPPF